MKTMFVLKLPTPDCRPQRYLRFKGGPKLGGTLSCTSVEDLDQASKCSTPELFSRMLPGVEGTPVEIQTVIFEPGHKSALHYLSELLEKEKTFAQEQVDTARLPEDRKDAGRDIEKIDLLKELLGLN